MGTTNQGPNIKSFATATVAVVLWLAVALAIDRWLLARYCESCSSTIALGLKVKLPAAELSYPPVSLLVMILLPMVLSAFYLVPWRHLRVRSAWQESAIRWCQPWFWLLVAVVLTIVCESAFMVAESHLPRGFAGLAERFTVTATLSVLKNQKALSFRASLGGFLGLVLGGCLFIAHGVREIFKLPTSQVGNYSKDYWQDGTSRDTSPR